MDIADIRDKADELGQRLTDAEDLLRAVQSRTLWEEAYDIRTLLVEVGEILAKQA